MSVIVQGKKVNNNQIGVCRVQNWPEGTHAHRRSPSPVWHINNSQRNWSSLLFYWHCVKALSLRMQVNLHLVVCPWIFHHWRSRCESPVVILPCKLNVQWSSFYFLAPNFFLPCRHGACFCELPVVLLVTPVQHFNTIIVQFGENSFHLISKQRNDAIVLPVDEQKRVWINSCVNT